MLDQLTRGPLPTQARASGESVGEAEAILIGHLRSLLPRVLPEGESEPAARNWIGPGQAAARSGGDEHVVVEPQTSPAVYPTLAGFRIVREVGHGGMGVVYEAEEELLSRRVALKVLPASALHNPKHVQRFEREAKAAGRLHHTNIVPVFGVSHREGSHYYVMQYIEGVGLDAVLRELRRLREAGANPPQGGSLQPRADGDGNQPEPPLRPEIEGHLTTTTSVVARSLATGRFAEPGPLPADRPATEPDSGETLIHAAPKVATDKVQLAPSSLVLPGSSHLSSHSDLSRPYFQSVARIGLQVAEALEYANREGVLHRDIKPSNLLLDTKGNVWVTDFGLAKTADTDDLTDSGDIVGTVRYMAPERFQGWCDARSERLQPGTDPLRAGGSAPGVRRIGPTPAHRTGAPRGAGAAPDVGPEGAAGPGDDHHQGDRPRAGAAVRDGRGTGRRIAAVSGGQADPARRASPPERAMLWCRRYPWVATSLAFLVLGTTISVWEAYRATRAEAATSKQRDIARSEAVRARDAEGSAKLAEATARSERDRAEFEAANALALNDFLTKDLLGQASAYNQAHPDPDLKVRTVLDRAAATIGERFADRPLLLASIRLTLGNVYEQLGLYREALPQMETALELQRRVRGADHPDTLLAQVARGGLALADGKLAEAESLLLGALKGLERVRGPDHLDTLDAKYMVGQLYLDQYKFADAERICEQVYDAYRRVKGADDLKTLYAANNLAVACLDQNKFARAEELLKGVIEAMGRIRDMDHPDLMEPRMNLARVYGALGRLDEQERVIKDVLKTQRRIFGRSHPETVRSLHDLGYIDIKRGSLDEAEAVLKEAVEGARTMLDPNHELRLAVVAQLADVYAQKGKLKELGPVLLEARDILRLRYGADNGIMANANSGVGKYYIRMNEPAKAEPYFREELAYRSKAAPGEFSRFAAEAWLGASLLGQKKYAEAEPLLLSGYRGMKARAQGINAGHQAELRRAIGQIIRFTDEAKQFHDRAAFDAILAAPDVKGIVLDLPFPAEPFDRPISDLVSRDSRRPSSKSPGRPSEPNSSKP